MNYTKLIKTARIGASVLTAISALLLFLSFLFAFDAQNGYFTDAALPKIFIIVYAVGIIICLATIFAANKDRIIKTKCEQNSNVSYAIIGLITIFLGIFDVLFNKSAHESVTMMTGVGTCAFGMYFLLRALKKDLPRHLLLVCLFFSAALPLGIAMSNNSNYYRHINSVENSLCAIASASLMLYILYEGKSLFEERMPRARVSSMLLSSFCSLSFATPYFLAFLVGGVYEEYRFKQMLPVIIICILINLQIVAFINSAEAHTEQKWEELEREESEIAEEAFEKENEKNIIEAAQECVTAEEPPMAEVPTTEETDE